MKRWRVKGDIAFPIEDGTKEWTWVKYEDMLKEVRRFIDDLGGIGDHITDKDIEDYFND